jgi:hypothetical protein
MHLSPAATDDAIRLLDGREFGALSVEKFGDILGHADRVERKFLREKTLVERATGIEPVSEAWEASVLPLY